MGLMVGIVAGNRCTQDATMRQPSVFVRELRRQEGAQLRRIARIAKQFARRQGAQILLASATRMSAPQIAALVRTDENQVRRVIHEFNTWGWNRRALDEGADDPRRSTS